MSDAVISIIRRDRNGDHYRIGNARGMHLGTAVGLPAAQACVARLVREGRLSGPAPAAPDRFLIHRPAALLLPEPRQAVAQSYNPLGSP